MKNIQIIDGAMNCTYSIFQATQTEFERIFPEDGQDIEYSEDLHERLREDAQKILTAIWQRPIEKRFANGIHGTLYYGMLGRKEYYGSKKEKDIDERYINEAQRRMFRGE